MTHTVLSVLRAAEGWLDQHKVEAPRRSAELLLGKVLGLDRLQIYLQHDRPLSDDERGAMRSLIARRGKHEPVAHLLGEWSFRGHVLEVSSAVLVPRPETEEMVDLALARLPQGARVLELGTGSGAIAIALALERKDLHIVATDVSKNALAVAERNINRHGLGERVTLRHGSWWDACAGELPFDALVSNPPYVDPALPDLLADDVRTFEPPLALFSERGDPASCYRAIAVGIESHVREGGAVILETGVGASDAALAVLLDCAAVEHAELHPDLAGRPRFLLARRR